MTLRRWFSRYALGLWFLGVAALGLLRLWMEWREAGGSPLPADAWLWLAGSAVCAVLAVIALWKARRR